MEDLKEKSSDGSLHGVKFRYYIPKDENLRKLYKNSLEDYSEIETTVDAQIDECIQNYESEDALSLVRPSRQNWDIKRELNRKRQILSAKTDLAILKLLHENKNKDQVLIQHMAQAEPEDSDDMELE
ncbi:hypothetical protein BEWA_034600 [Theileria equi strain WA]|uniref:Uncharacterized protein n=1 Tax=Theileria equi strain WA TaxID=1537102 RepID=L0AYD4_THEEQ|nr:hypothetical protein BEWA_034600 [Theileria equi strain WA]AFZ80602.1 hypothetical protein BEWA_034600 [Theileria equi strain WA]|eukprot:XP_004830268.1 hypothetical protein BEWA_034600 [Theileria equi strain WA]